MILEKKNYCAFCWMGACVIYQQKNKSLFNPWIKVTTSMSWERNLFFRWKEPSKTRKILLLKLSFKGVNKLTQGYGLSGSAWMAKCSAQAVLKLAQIISCYIRGWTGALGQTWYSIKVPFAQAMCCWFESKN